jgi:hypothetical protein
MHKTRTQIIELHPLAPPKPGFGESCNGCGFCCAAEPCPVAYIFLFQFKGRCRALLWQNDSNRYVCGMVVRPDHYVKWIPQRLRERMGKFCKTRIAAGSGCDFVAEVVDTKI